jgi:hypothetical protein
MCAMTVLQALAILEAAVLECKKRSIDTPEVREALDLLEPYIQPEWFDSTVSPQYRRRAGKGLSEGGGTTGAPCNFPRYPRRSSRTSWVRTDALARKFHETHDMKVKDELDKRSLASALSSVWLAPVDKYPL